MELLQLAEFETAARTGVPPDVWDYLQGGSGTESTLGANVAAFKRIVVRPRVLVDISARDLGTTLLGTPLDFPVAIATMAFQPLTHPPRPVPAAAAAREAGT